LKTDLEGQNLARRFFISLFLGSATLEAAMAKFDVPVEPHSEPTPPPPAPQEEPSERMKQCTTLARGLISVTQAEARDRGWDGSEGIMFHFQLVGTPHFVDVTLGKTPDGEKPKPQKAPA
jgi:hypothetical protein